ncbi:MAG TPA: hypothetical protein VL728_03940 [Cyclobacteriaceae bacterium]|jgi:hypothetical protein|nr:hypothetical protein [Cyclobacteriaceae bacterium]
MTDNPKFTIVPYRELITFGIALTCIIVATFLTELGGWLASFIALFSYLMIVGRAKIIRLNNNILTVSPLLPLLGSHSIDKSAIVSVKSFEEYNIDSVITGEVYPILKKEYAIVYRTETGTTREAVIELPNTERTRDLLKELNTFKVSDQ